MYVVYVVSPEVELRVHLPRGWEVCYMNDLSCPGSCEAPSLGNRSPEGGERETVSSFPVICHCV